MSTASFALPLSFICPPPNKSPIKTRIKWGKLLRYKYSLFAVIVSKWHKLGIIHKNMSLIGTTANLVLYVCAVTIPHSRRTTANWLLIMNYCYCMVFFNIQRINRMFGVVALP